MLHFDAAVSIGVPASAQGCSEIRGIKGDQAIMNIKRFHISIFADLDSDNIIECNTSDVILEIVPKSRATVHIHWRDGVKSGGWHRLGMLDRDGAQACKFFRHFPASPIYMAMLGLYRVLQKA